MKRLVLLITVSMVVVAAMLVFAGPASAQEGCKDFGQNIAGLATSLGPSFGQTASGSAPLNDTVAQEHRSGINYMTRRNSRGYYYLPEIRPATVSKADLSATSSSGSSSNESSIRRRAPRMSWSVSQGFLGSKEPCR